MNNIIYIYTGNTTALYIIQRQAAGFHFGKLKSNLCLEYEDMDLHNADNISSVVFRLVKKIIPLGLNIFTVIVFKGLSSENYKC